MTDYLTSIELTIPYEQWFNLLNVIGDQPARVGAVLWEKLHDAREDATTDDLTLRLDYDTVYRVADWLALAPTHEAGTLFLLFKKARRLHEDAVRAERVKAQREQWEREAPMRAVLDALEEALPLQPTTVTIGQGLPLVRMPS